VSDSDEDSLELNTVLEAPPSLDSPGANMGSLLTEDSLASVMARGAAVDSFLRLITRDCNFQDFMRELLLIVMKAVKSEAGSILEVNHSSNTLFFRAVVGQSSDHLTKFTVPIGQGLAGHVAESRQPFVVDNISENKIHLKSIQKAVGFDARNLVAMPIVVRGKIYGVLELLNRVGESSFTPADVELLNYLCETMAKAIEARLLIGWNAKSTSTSKKEAA